MKEKLVEDLVSVIRCKDCGYYHHGNLVCDRPFESPVCRLPDDFCSHAAMKAKQIFERKEKEK